MNSIKQTKQNNDKSQRYLIQHSDSHWSARNFLSCDLCGANFFQIEVNTPLVFSKTNLHTLP